jgi:hypothetical protein
MLITLYTPIGIVYQKFEINEYDLKYNDLIKYINLPKNELYDEIDELYKSKELYKKVFIKTIINLFTYENSEKINLDDEIICNNNEFTIVFSYEYYIYYNCYNDCYIKIENNIKNCNNVFDEIKNNPYQIIFIENNDANYNEICKFAIQKDSYTLQCIKNQTYEICKLAIQNNGYTLKFVKPELMTDEICKLAVQQSGFALQYVKPELMTYEICKLAVSKNGSSLQYVKPEFMTDEIYNLAVQKDRNALCYVKPQLMTYELCLLAVQEDGYALQYVKPELMTYEICKLAVQQNGDALCFVKPEFKTSELLKLIR